MDRALLSVKGTACGENAGGVVKRAWTGSKETWLLLIRSPFFSSYLSLEKVLWHLSGPSFLIYKMHGLNQHINSNAV